MDESTEEKVDSTAEEAPKVEDPTEKMIEMKVQAALTRMNNPAMTPLKAPAQRGFPGASPPIQQAHRPMLPAAPAPLRPPNPRGLQTSTTAGPQRPLTPHAKALLAQAEKNKAGIQQRPTMCPECGGDKRINVKRDKKNNVVGYDPCPRCVEM